MRPENVQGTMAWRSTDFIERCEREFHLTNVEAAQLASQFGIMGQPQLIDQMKFSTLVSQEQRKFEQILSSFDMELRELQKQLRQRHTGVYKWF